MLLVSRARRGSARVAGLAVAFTLGASVLTSAATAAVGHARRPAPGPVVATEAGLVRGLATGAADQYRGIPYAAPPVGQLRWRPPQPVAGHPRVVDATSFAPHCAQPGTPLGRGTFGTASTSEDCLYLNVYEPAGSAPVARLPVLVWIHGGGLTTGQSDSYDPAPLVRHGVVVVTINYRLGALGFLAHPALSAEAAGSSGDYGLMDQQAALRWVQRNIAHFGGNPRNVTIFGESAGGLSVLAQLASPGAAGLFARAVVQSGAYALTQASQAAANAAGTRFAAAVGCTDQTAACLRSRPVAQLLAQQHTGVWGYQPNIDHRVLPRSIAPALAGGQFHRVPLLNGSTADEGRLLVALGFDLAGGPVTAAGYRSAISATLGVDAASAAAIARQYPLRGYPSPDLALAAVSTDAAFACPARRVDQLASRYVPTYAYEFADEHAPQRFLPPVSFPYGASHGAELQYLFDLLDAPRPGRLAPAQQQLASTMQRYWTSFAARGTPAGPGGTPRWPAYQATSEHYQRLVPPQPTTTTGFAVAHQCTFWSSHQPVTTGAAPPEQPGPNRHR